MIKTYKVGTETWHWDTETLCWSTDRKKPEPPKAQVLVGREPEPSPTLEWQNWRGYLYFVFYDCRLSKNWHVFRELHDEEDNKFFDLLESHYKSGSLKVKERQP